MISRVKFLGVRKRDESSFETFWLDHNAFPTQFDRYFEFCYFSLSHLQFFQAYLPFTLRAIPRAVIKCHFIVDPWYFLYNYIKIVNWKKMRNTHRQIQRNNHSENRWFPYVYTAAVHLLNNLLACLFVCVGSKIRVRTALRFISFRWKRNTHTRTYVYRII